MKEKELKIAVRGPARLTGRVKVSGSKNAVLPILAATLITDKKCILRNVPRLSDITVMCGLLEMLGKKITWKDSGLEIVTAGEIGGVTPYEMVRKLRASVLVMGGLASRKKKLKVALPGGCAIGERPIDIHLRGFAKLGAETSVSGGFINMNAENLGAARINLDFPSVGATENLAIAACGSTDKTVLENIAAEPEIEELFSFLKSLGAKVKYSGSTVSIKGRSRYGGSDFTVMDDRIQAGTYMIAGALPGSNIRMDFSSPETLDSLKEKLMECGAEIEEGRRFIRVKGPSVLKSTDVRTSPYPGFPTDMQAPFMALMALAPGTSVINETVFENRFLHCGELRRMGADIEIKGQVAVVGGENRLGGAPVRAKDLRGGAALVIAALGAEGITRISGTWHIRRGYHNIVENFKKLGADIWTE